MSEQNQEIHRQFELVLTKLYRGEPVLPDAQCYFNYTWNMQTNMGIAHLLDINGTPLNITLHPLGLQGMYAFMSDMRPTPYVISGKRVVIYRVLLHVDPENNRNSCAIMFNQDGSTIETSEYWSLDDAQADFS